MGKILRTHVVLAKAMRRDDETLGVEVNRLFPSELVYGLIDEMERLAAENAALKAAK